MPEIVISIDPAIETFLGTIKAEGETIDDAARRMILIGLEKETTPKWSKPQFKIIDTRQAR